MTKSTKTRVMSINTIKNRKFHSLTSLDPEWMEMFGEMERNFKMIIYGASTSGKSSLALRFADHLSKRLNAKVLYNNWEEGINKTVQSRINERGITAARLYVSDRMPFDEMLDKIKRLYYRVVVIDSVKFMAMTYDQYKTLTATFPTKAFIFLAHGTSEASTDGANDILKACDVKVFVKDGVAHISSRYSGEKRKVKLFDHVKSTGGQGVLQLNGGKL